MIFVVTTSFVISLMFVTIPFFVNAETEDTAESVQAQCFTTLKENLKEAGTFSQPLIELNKLSYPDIESKFSENYKNLSSFGIELDKPLLEMRVYSFGRQTGYVHPPKLPFPSSYKSDTWIDPAKEFIISEEYSVDANARKHFISCSLFTISSDDLLAVTRERYAYDGQVVSLLKIPPSGDYKAWYSQNISYDNEDKAFVNWTRLFIYPKATENTFFDKYSLAEEFPANKTPSFDVLRFFLKDVITLKNRDESGVTQVKYLIPDTTGKPVEIEAPKELSPINPSEANKQFPFTTYYQAIEAHFPEFATALSLRGTLKYETYKKIITDPEIDPEINKIVSTLTNARQLTQYALNKEILSQQGIEVSDPDMDKMLSVVKDADTVVNKIIAENKDLKNLQNKTLTTATTQLPLVNILIMSALFITALAAFVWWRRSKRVNIYSE